MISNRISGKLETFLSVITYYIASNVYKNVPMRKDILI